MAPVVCCPLMPLISPCFRHHCASVLALCWERGSICGGIEIMAQVWGGKLDMVSCLKELEPCHLHGEVHADTHPTTIWEAAHSNLPNSWKVIEGVICRIPEGFSGWRLEVVLKGGGGWEGVNVHLEPGLSGNFFLMNILRFPSWILVALSQAVENN